MMDFLYTTKYGNSAEQYLIAIAILVTSLFVSRWVYTILRRTFCDWLFNIQNIFEKEALYRLTNLTSFLIPILGFYLAKRKLFFTKEISLYLNLASLVSGQIVFLLILANVLEPVAEVIVIRSVRDVWRRDQKYLQNQKQSIAIVKTHIRVLTRILLLLIPGMTIATSVTAVPMEIWAAPLAIAIFEVALCLRIIQKTKASFKKKQDVAVKAAADTSVAAEIAKSLDDPDLELKETIVKFFLDIYKHGLRVMGDSPAEICLVDSHSFAPNYIYQLRVIKDGEWQSRRMTIGPIGEATGSRSKCFYVIYDHHLVIKIPAIPMNDLTTYMGILKKEREIVKKLAMKECIIPSASVILKLVQRFEKKGDLPSDDREDDYLKFLNIFSELQKYLKIGNTFAFFMDLSKYYFLGHIIQAFHDMAKKVDKEIARHSEVVGDYLRFQDRYGEENSPLFLKVEKLRTKYESELKKLQKQFDLPASFSRDQVKNWFCIHMVGKRITEIDKGLRAEFIVEVNRLLDRIVSEKSHTIQAYRKVITKAIDDDTVSQNKGYMEGVITNLLELLAHLAEKKVAMRDLKPDNLLVAGNKDKYPGFLAYPQDYKIGLIDVETAVILPGPGRGIMAQPPLGGTPQFATPSHFFSNDLLGHLYPNLANILHLQDWYAIIAIIYRVVVGLPLFEQTAQILPGIIKGMNEHKGNQLEHFNSVNKLFWHSAINEFNEKIAQREQTLRSLHVLILDGAKKMLREFALEEKGVMAEQIHRHVHNHNMPMGEKDRQFLNSCSYAKTKKLRRKWEERSETGMENKIDRSQLVSLLRKLEELKLRLEQQTQLLELLNHSTPWISAHQLMEFMFGLVINRMYNEEGLPLSAGDLLRYDSGNGNSSSQATVSVTSDVQP